jgi:lipid A 3-O-deacylase
MNNVSTEKWARSAIALGVFAMCAAHADTPTPSAELATNYYSPPALTLSQPSVWENGVGEGFRKGAQEVGVGVSFAPGTKIMGTRHTHNLLLTSVQAGWMISDVVKKDSWLRGNWEFLAEPFGGFQINKTHASLGGLDLFIRYNFATGTRIVPFFEAGLGALWTDIGKPDLGGEFQFNEKCGAGAQFFITEHFSANLECRFMHISNAGIESPNHGINSVPFCLSLSYFF